MADFITKDGRNVTTFDMTFRRIAVGAVAVPIPLASEFLRIKSDPGNGAVIVYVGGADVDVVNGYPLTAGDNLQLSGGLGQYIAANTVYVVATGNCYVYYVIHN